MSMSTMFPIGEIERAGDKGYAKGLRTGECGRKARSLVGRYSARDGLLWRHVPARPSERWRGPSGTAGVAAGRDKKQQKQASEAWRRRGAGRGSVERPETV